MQPLKRLQRYLADSASAQSYLFTPADLRSLFADLSESAFKGLLNRSAKDGCLVRVCRGLYLYPRAAVPYDLLLFHAAARLRADTFNYISLETALSDAGFISQLPINWITVMSAGRSNTIQCGSWGRIEFVHTSRTAQDVQAQLTFDARCHLWRAMPELALRDMRVARRNLDLIDMQALEEKNL